MDNTLEQVKKEEIVIHLKDIVVFFKINRKYILLGTLIGSIVGVVYAFSNPNTYTAQVVVMPEIQSRGVGNLSGLGSLAGLAGINLDNLNTQDAIRPDLYPDVLKSVPFGLYILNQEIYSPKFGGKMPLEIYMNKIDKHHLIDRIKDKLFEDKGTTTEKASNHRIKIDTFSEAIQLTEEQSELIKIIQVNITANYDRKTGMLSISCIEPEPVVAATVARLSLNYLTNYITTYRTEKSRQQVIFLENQVRDAKNRYQNTEYALSSYRDLNRSLFLNTAKIAEQRLQADYLLAQSVYNELSKQLEQAKIKVQEEVPIFKVLEPSTVPLYKSGPKRVPTIIGTSIIGALITFTVLLGQLILKRHSVNSI